MPTGTYRLADVPVQITSLHDEVQTMCAPYRTDEAPLLHIATTAQDIEAESRMSDEERLQEGLPEYHFPAPYLETLAVYRQLATQLLSQGVLLMHGSVIAVDGEGYLFTALSGTGKSTHVRLWRQLFGERAIMVNDDKPLIRVRSEELGVRSNSPSCIDSCEANNSSLLTPNSSLLTPNSSLYTSVPLVYGTPWDGKHHLSTNISVPLKAIIHLQRGAENHIEPLAPAEMLPVLLQQTFRPHSPLGTMQVLQLLDALSQHVSFYSLHCNMEPDAARVAYEGISI